MRETRRVPIEIGTVATEKQAMAARSGLESECPGCVVMSSEVAGRWYLHLSRNDSEDLQGRAPKASLQESAFGWFRGFTAGLESAKSTRLRNTPKGTQ